MTQNVSLLQYASVLCAVAAPLLMFIAGMAAPLCSKITGVSVPRLAQFCSWVAWVLALAAAGLLGWNEWLGSNVPEALRGFYFDRVSSVMLVLVGLLGAVVLRYSQNYLAGDPGQERFTSFLCLTLGSVLLLVVSGNLLLFFAAWISTSLCLHRLLVFYPERPAALIAARKKFIISRIGDACLLVAIVLIGKTYGSLDFAILFERVGTLPENGNVHFIAILLVAGALLKSAQFPFHTWLPETMETPTPVSALMHAGIINAGGFLIIRLSPLVAPSAPALQILMVVGAVTALFASLVMLTQTTVKKSLAYSTVAQMGFMMLQCGLGAFSLALLHIIAHSLYKAHAFLSSGSVVELARSAWVPKGTGKAHPVALAFALVAVAAGTAAVASIFDLGLDRKPGVVVLGMILMFGVIHLLWNSWIWPLRGAVVLRGALLAVGVCGAYFLLHVGAEVLFGGSVAPVPDPTRLDQIMMGLVLFLFAAALVVQSQIPYRRSHPLWQALYVHASHGFYLTTVANRWIARLYSTPVAPPTSSFSLKS